ncbi:MAG TPA: mycofactocin biosynthesis chaperone MftB [Mycobacteriales bacterium]|nr:mycofactocin biosynthesis chaperone MftB [Mycobacteriales bacterium]
MECAVSISPVTRPNTTPFDLDRSWRLHPSVAVRPESFGALLYHFGTRRLSFLKSPKLLDVVQSLEGASTARAACAIAGVAPADLPSYQRALATLAASDMILAES